MYFTLKVWLPPRSAVVIKSWSELLKVAYALLENGLAIEPPVPFAVTLIPKTPLTGIVGAGEVLPVYEKLVALALTATEKFLFERTFNS